MRFPGQYYDQETGLHYNDQRYYDLGTGRYSTSDPIGLEAELNTCLYANANPVKFTDPFGLDTPGYSPNPNRPKPKTPGLGSAICAGANAACAERERQEQLENGRHQRNQELINQSCSTSRDDCRHAPNAPDCIEDVRKRCAPQETEEFERHIKAMQNIRSIYPVNADLKTLCDLLP